MKCIKGILLACVAFCSSVQAVDKLIAENPMIVFKIQSFEALKKIVPAQAQQQVMMVEMMAPKLDKAKEAVVVLTSIMPPVAYAALPVVAGTQLNEVTAVLPPNLQASAQIRDNYVFLPFTGMLPQNIGKGKFAKKNDSTLQLNLDIDLINKLSGPMVAMMLQQDFSAMLPQVDPNSDKLMKASIDLYRFYLLDLLKTTKSLDVDVNKVANYTIDFTGEFKAGSTWAGICEKHSAISLPECETLGDSPVSFAAEMDYSTMKPLMEPMNKYMAAVGDLVGGKDFNKLMESFMDMGSLKMVGGMKMDQTKMEMNYLFAAKDGYEMNGAIAEWQSFFPKDNKLGMSFDKTGNQIEGQEVYKYDMGDAYKQPGMPSIDTLIFAKKNMLY